LRWWDNGGPGARARAGTDLRILATGKNDILNERIQFQIRLPSRVATAFCNRRTPAMASRITLLTMGYVEI
jgi:hypothetical protein